MLFLRLLNIQLVEPMLCITSEKCVHECSVILEHADIEVQVRTSILCMMKHKCHMTTIDAALLVFIIRGGGNTSQVTLYKVY